MARIRTGNEEEIRFFKDIDAKTGFLRSVEITEESIETVSREIEIEGQKVSQRISLHEIYETNEIERIIKECNEVGLDHSFFNNSMIRKVTIKLL